MEVALALPLVILVSFCCVWLVDTMRLQAAAQDAARVVARELVRGVPASAAQEQGRRVLPQANFRVTSSQGFVHVQARRERAWLVPVDGPWRHPVSADAVGHLEAQLLGP